MIFDFSVRSPEIEIMDDFEMSGDLLLESIEQIAKINQILGGNQITINGIKQLSRNVDRPIRVLDIGCGGGHMCRKIVNWAKKTNTQIELVGIDANEAAIEYSQKLSRQQPSISFKNVNVFDPNFSFDEFDIAVITLTLHHFTDDQIQSLLHKLSSSIKLGIVINDLQRSKLAFKLYQLLCSLFRFNHMVRYDGSISIRSGFKREELEAFSKQLKLKSYSIKWCWAFRYQWIINTK